MFIRRGLPRMRRAILTAVLAAVTGGALGAVPLNRLELTLKTGADWNHVKKFGVAKVTLLPQYAVWVERDDGTYVGELFVTDKTGKSSWGKVRRPEALPVWSHARGVRYDDGLYMPTKRDPLPDAVTGATPKAKTAGAAVRHDLRLPAGLSNGRYRVCVELNNSFDYNEVYAENLPRGDARENGVNGQPSVVYAAIIDLAGTADADAIPLVFVGAGHPQGSDGMIRTGREGLTNALTIVESLTVRVR